MIGIDNKGYIVNEKYIYKKIEYVTALLISFSRCLIVAYKKNGNTTTDEVDIKGSFCIKPNIIANNKITVEINGIFLSINDFFKSNSFIYTNRLILIKDNRYGNKAINKVLIENNCNESFNINT